MENKSILKGGLSIISQCKKKQMIFGMRILELQLLVIFMKDNNIDEETARNMYSQTRMMLNKKKLVR